MTNSKALLLQSPREQRRAPAPYSAPHISEDREWGGTQMRIIPADLARARMRELLSVRLGASFGRREWEFKLDISRQKAQEPDLTQPDYGLSGTDREPSLGYADSRQVTSADRPAWSQEAHGNISAPKPESTSGNGNMGSVNFWGSLTGDQKRVFRAKAHERAFAAGARLMQEGEHGDHVAVIVSGLTEIRVREEDAERVVATRGPGQLIGERAALEVNPRSATVVALQTVVALVMRTADFAAFVSTYPSVLKIVEEQIYTRLREGGAGPRQDGSWGNQMGHELTPPRLVLTGQNCTVVRTDVVGFGAEERDPEAHKIIRREIVTMTRLALGTAWDTCRREDRGDGELIIVPPDIPTAHVIERLISALPAQLKRHNRIYGPPSQIRLRVAVEVGPIEDDESGAVGRSIVGVARLLDADPFKQAMANAGALLGVIVSPFVYETHISPGGSTLDPADYTEIPVHVKETHRSAWMQLIGTAQLGQVQLATSGASSPCSRV